jgi:hypothetical protein
MANIRATGSPGCPRQEAGFGAKPGEPRCRRGCRPPDCACAPPLVISGRGAQVKTEYRVAVGCPGQTVRLSRKG